MGVLTSLDEPRYWLEEKEDGNLTVWDKTSSCGAGFNSDQKEEAEAYLEKMNQEDNQRELDLIRHAQRVPYHVLVRRVEELEEQVFQLLHLKRILGEIGRL